MNDYPIEEIKELCHAGDIVAAQRLILDWCKAEKITKDLFILTYLHKAKAWIALCPNGEEQAKMLKAISYAENLITEGA
jgi:hypothetical protein